MLAVLCDSSEAQIFLSIVEPVMINVVDDATGGDLYNASVHVDRLMTRISSVASVALCVICAGIFCEMPLVFVESVEILGIDASKAAFCERYSSEGMTISYSAIEKDRINYSRFEPIRDFDSDLFNCRTRLAETGYKT